MINMSDYDMYLELNRLMRMVENDNFDSSSKVLELVIELQIPHHIIKCAKYSFDNRYTEPYNWIDNYDMKRRLALKHKPDKFWASLDDIPF